MTNQEFDGEVVFYQPDDNINLEVRLSEETVWLNRQQLAQLFDRDVKTIGKHIANALKEELTGIPTVAKFATVQMEGERMVQRDVEYYNLDMILSLGYRVKSSQGIKFRQWANKVLKQYLLNGYAINQQLKAFQRQIDNRFDLQEEKIHNIEKRLNAHDEKIDFFIRTNIPPVEKVYADGNVFDAYVFTSELIKFAKNSVILIDNYIDETVFTLLDKRAEDVSAKIYTSHRCYSSEQIQLDIQRHNQQYPEITILDYGNRVHDRFLIIDDEVYHFGASLKDLGKKVCAVMKMEESKETILRIIEN